LLLLIARVPLTETIPSADNKRASLRRSRRLRRKQAAPA